MHTLELDVRLAPGVRVKRVTGCRDKRTVKAMREMIRLLWKQPRGRALVMDIIEARRSLLDVYHAFLAGDLATLPPTADQDRPIADVVQAWFESPAAREVSEGHRKRLRQVFTQLLRVSRGNPLLSHLPLVVEDYRTHCEHADTPRAFNYAKMGCLTLIRDTLKRSHALYGAVQDVPSMLERKQGVKPLTVDEARAVRDRLPENAARIWWAMCCTGMGPTEYWGEWHVLPDRVRIVGTKRAGRRWSGEGRDVPCVTTLERPSISMNRFQKLLRPAGGLALPGPQELRQLAGGRRSAADASPPLLGPRREGRHRPLRAARSDCVPSRGPRPFASRGAGSASAPTNVAGESIVGIGGLACRL